VKYVSIVLVAGVVIALRVAMRRRHRAHPATDNERSDTAAPVRRFGSRSKPTRGLTRRRRAIEDSFGIVGMVASREIKERVRGRIFRVGTLLILVVVAAAIIVPTLHSAAGPTTQTVGVVGGLSTQAKQVLRVAAAMNHDSVKLRSMPSLAEAEAELRAGRLDLAIVNGDQILLDEPASSANSPADPSLVGDAAEYLGVLQAYRVAGLTPRQATEVARAKPVQVKTLEPTARNTTKATSVIGLVLLFFMLTQYCTWILIGVMQEKSSRVVEVLLATMRPIQLLGGKVLGIGLVALGQATLVVGFALIVAEAVGSDLLRGTAPLVLLCELLWLVLGYAFYCWVYAAAGSTAERQDQVQTLALPLSIPILLGYIFAITVASSGGPDFLFKVLAYLPPTAPFCMPVLVGLGDVTWWGFVASVLITIAATAGMAIFAARIYRRAVLRTGGRVRLRELLVRNPD
jgi:ABC-2 type transport system permease protein